MTMKRKHLLSCLILGVSAFTAQVCSAITFELPSKGNVVGTMQTATVGDDDTLSSIGRRYDIGGYEMIEANPDVPYMSPKAGSTLVIPTRFVLPSGSRKGIVVNLAEMRLYFYHPDGMHVSTYPIGIGQDGWLTPLGNTTIVRMRENPWWIVPDSILENHAAHGDPIPEKMPPGPENPLGEYAMNLGFKNIVIHGSPYPMGVGVRSSHGCIRMLNEDVEELFKQVHVGTSVRVVHEPYKVGNLGDTIYLEVHVPLQEAIYQTHTPVEQAVHELANKESFGTYSISWPTVEELKQHSTGYPQQIGVIQDIPQNDSYPASPAIAY